jgi:hypothetical protein
MRAEEALAPTSTSSPETATTTRTLRPLLAIAIILEGCFLALWKVGTTSADVPFYLGIFFASFAAYGLAAAFVLKGRFAGTPRISGFLFVCAFVFRATVLPLTPSMSEDIYRYIWDGRNQVAGIGPYDYAPGAPQLERMRDYPHYDLINHKDYKTPYPAGAETAFHWLAALAPKVIIFKSAFLVFDLLLIEVLRRLLKKEGLSQSMLLIYAWHPMTVLEFAGNGHMDILGISLLFLSYLLLDSQRILSGTLLAIASLIKYLPIAALPWMIKKGGWSFVLFGALVGGALVFQYYTTDLRMLSGVFVFYRKWWFNDSLFGVLYKWLGGAEAARVWGSFFVGLTAIYCFAAGHSFYKSLFFIFTGVLLFSPVVHPWYLCWVIPFLCFHPSRPWLFFTGWIALSYLIRYLFPGGVWGQVLWLKLLVYVPFYALLLFCILDPRYHPQPVLAPKRS